MKDPTDPLPSRVLSFLFRCKPLRCRHSSKGNASVGVDFPVLLGAFLLLLYFSAPAARGEQWTPPTSEELQMTAEPAAPGAVAVYLMRDERADDKLHMHSLYVRLKILTEEGKDYADVELSYDRGGGFAIRSIEGRTIHSDGTVIPFTGKPYEKVLIKSKTLQYKAKVFSLPDVQVGSILEYRYVLTYDDYSYFSPQWYIQQQLYVRKAHYQFLPGDRMVQDRHGTTSEGSLAWTPNLPRGAEVKYIPSQKSYALDVEKIPPIPEEEYMPPLQSISYRVLFYYTTARTPEDYWKSEGKYWSGDIDKFMSPGKLTGIVGQLVTASDTPEQKARKLYDAIMKLENTSFTRTHSTVEDKAQGLKIKTADDIWNVKRGSADEIAILYVGLLRAAGLRAYVAAVTNRDRAFFLPNYLSTSQLDDDLAIVELGGQDQFLDPGERYCPFGELHWKHSMVRGLRQVEHGTTLTQTPVPGYKSTTVLRNADLTMSSDGQVKGTLRIFLTGSEALLWRQRAISTDEAAIKEEFQQSIQAAAPSGVELKTTSFLALDDYSKTLVANLTVTGSMGTATAKRVFLPTSFFAAAGQPFFVHEKRTVPVSLNYPYGSQDTVVLHLPKGWIVESTPKDAKIPLPQNAVYQVSFKLEPGQIQASRIFLLANSSYGVDEYPQLKEFYQKANAKDQEQAVLGFAPPSAPGGAR